MKVSADFIICGAGIAGLWLLTILKQKGYSAILLESDTVGSGQSSKAQGIIHGGLKYALQGTHTSSSLAIADMPEVWKDCLLQKGQIDLSDVNILSDKQFLFSPKRFSGKLTGFFAGLTLQNKVKPLTKTEFPKVFQNAKFKGTVYSLDEMTLDVNSVLKSLYKKTSRNIFQIQLQDQHFCFDENNNLKCFLIDGIEFHAQRFIFTAGIGNETIANKCFKKTITQRRPLHMVLVKHNIDQALFAHCLNLRATPRFTITTHKAHDGKWIWYIGGGIAEEGVQLNSEEQIKQTKKELKSVFPWLDFTDAQFASFFVDRAESFREDGKKPDEASIETVNNIFLCWPIKFAFAPALSEKILALTKNIDKTPGKLDALEHFKHASLCTPIWDELLP